MKVLTVFVPIAMIFALCSGCISMQREEVDAYYELKSVGVPTKIVKSPAAAGFLNLLPGFGSFYLAQGTDQRSQWYMFGVNFLLWPVSITWGIPQAIIDANTINKLETVHHPR